MAIKSFNMAAEAAILKIGFKPFQQSKVAPFVGISMWIFSFIDPVVWGDVYSCWQQWSWTSWPWLALAWLLVRWAKKTRLPTYPCSEIECKRNQNHNSYIYVKGQPLYWCMSSVWSNVTNNQRMISLLVKKCNLPGSVPGNSFILKSSSVCILLEHLLPLPPQDLSQGYSDPD